VNFRTPVTTYGAQLQNALRSGNHDLTVGADYSASVARSEPFNADGSRGTPYTPDASIESAAAFTQLRLSLLDDRLITTAGGRLDRFAFEILETPGLDLAEPNRETHSVFAPSAGARFSLVKGGPLTGNIGRGFITPTAFDVAGYAEQRAGTDRRAVTVTRGNPALRPETSWSWDAGIRVSRIPRLDLELTYFSTSVEDRIVSDTRATDGQELTPRGDTILAITTYHNVDEAEMRGIEGRASYRLLDGGDRAGAEIFAAGTRMLSAEERFVASDAAQSIHNVADLTLLGGVDVRRRAVGARLTARYVGERMDSDYLSWWEPGEIVYPPYLVLDLSAEIRASSRYRFGLELRNLLDEDYFGVRGYNMPGRALQRSVSADL